MFELITLPNTYYQADKIYGLNDQLFTVASGNPGLASTSGGLSGLGANNGAANPATANLIATQQTFQPIAHIHSSHLAGALGGAQALPPPLPPHHLTHLNSSNALLAAAFAQNVTNSQSTSPSSTTSSSSSSNQFLNLNTNNSNNNNNNNNSSPSSASPNSNKNFALHNGCPVSAQNLNMINSQNNNINNNNGLLFASTNCLSSSSSSNHSSTNNSSTTTTPTPTTEIRENVIKNSLRFFFNF
jgi:hypothetical protein